MIESPDQYVNRVFEYCMKANKPLTLNDVTPQAISKAAETIKEPNMENDVFDTMLKAYEQPVSKATVKTVPKTSSDALDALLKNYGV